MPNSSSPEADDLYKRTREKVSTINKKLLMDALYNISDFEVGIIIDSAKSLVTESLTDYKIALRKEKIGEAIMLSVWTIAQRKTFIDIKKEKKE